MKKDFKKTVLLKINTKKKSSEAFTEICQKLKLNRKRNVADALL